MSDLNLKATEFIPSWLKAKPTTATAATTTTPSASTTSNNNTSSKHHAPSSNGAPPAAQKTSQQQPSQAVQSPAQIPWKAPPPPATSNPSLAAAAAASAGVAARSHMNPHAVVFEPKFLTQQQTPTLKAQQPPPPTTQMTRPQSTTAGGTGRPAGVTIQVVPPQWPAPQKSNTSPKPAPLPPSPARGSAAAQPSPPLPSAKRVSHLLPPSSQPLTKTATSAATVAPKKTTPPPQIVKTDAEILAISERSNLKVGAAVFVPGQRSGSSLHAKNILMGKPSPLTLTPASPDTEMLLFDAWCLYCLCNSVTKEENYDPTLVFRIDSVPTFWKTMNNLPEPTGFAPPTTMYLFRDDIYPKWEDPKNVSGGVWKIRVDRDTIDDVWLVLACKTIGESWLKEHRNTINGIVLKVREKGFYIEVWVTERRDQFPGDLQGALSELLPAFMIDFYTHHQIQEAMKEHAAAPKGKNANKKGAKRK